MLRGDQNRLRQILLNLLSNAVKFTTEGEVEVTAEIQPAQSHPLGNEGLVKFDDLDTGAGIPGEVQARLFQAFSQAYSSTTRRFGGTGLGLAISKRLVELMGGEIGIVSEYRKGFHFLVHSTVRVTREYESGGRFADGEGYSSGGRQRR